MWVQVQRWVGSGSDSPHPWVHPCNSLGVGSGHIVNTGGGVVVGAIVDAGGGLVVALSMQVLWWWWS